MCVIFIVKECFCYGILLFQIHSDVLFVAYEGENCENEAKKDNCKQDVSVDHKHKYWLNFHTCAVTPKSVLTVLKLICINEGVTIDKPAKLHRIDPDTVKKFNFYLC